MSVGNRVPRKLNRGKGKAHQRKIREQRQQEYEKVPDMLFEVPSEVDIKKAVLREVSFKTAKRIITEYEWLGTMGTTQYHYGIYFEGVCAGVVCFGYFQAMNTNSGGHPYAPYVGEKYAPFGIQLTRGACAWWAHPHSGSKLISYGLNEIKKRGYKYVVAFSDPDAGEIGTLYQATNWLYLGFSTTTHYDIYHKTGPIFLNDRDFYKKFGCVGKKAMEDFVKAEPTLRVKLRSPKARYLIPLGTKKEKKEMMGFLSGKIFPYPKRSNNLTSERNVDET